LRRALPGNTVARHASQPQATEIGRLGALPAPGVFSRVGSKQALNVQPWQIHQGSMQVGQLATANPTGK